MQLRNQLPLQQHHSSSSSRHAATPGFRPFASSGSPARPCLSSASLASPAQQVELQQRSGGRRLPATKAHPDFRAYFGSSQQQTQGSSGGIAGSKPDLAQPLLFSWDVAGGQVPPTPDVLAEVLPLLTPKQLADAIWGFAKQGSRPAQDVMDAIASEVLSKLEHFRSPDLSNTIWALAVLKYQPSSQWWEAFERQVYQHLCDFSDREAANLMWSLAVLDHRPAWVLEPLLTSALDQLHAYSPNALHLLGWSCGKLGYCPSREWLSGYLKAAQASFFQFSPAEMSNIIWALAKLVPGSTSGSAQQQPEGSSSGGAGSSASGVYKVPAMWLDNFLMVTQWRFPSFSAKTLSVVAWAVASLGHTPSQEWLVLYEQQVREKFWDFNGQELACIAWALRRFGATPEHNAVFYMLERQEGFLEVDFEILSNSKLLGQVHQWRHEAASASSSSSSVPSSSTAPTITSSGSTSFGARGPRHGPGSAADASSSGSNARATDASTPAPVPPPQGAGAPPATTSSSMSSQPQAVPQQQEQQEQEQEQEQQQEQEQEPSPRQTRPAADSPAAWAQGPSLDCTMPGAGDRVSGSSAPRPCSGGMQQQQEAEGDALPPA